MRSFSRCALVVVFTGACGGEEPAAEERVYTSPEGDTIAIPCDLQAEEDLPVDELYELGRYHLALVNADRAFFQIESDGAEPLAWSDELWAVAICYAKDMCDRDFFSHTNPDGADVVDRVLDATGLVFARDYWAVAENLALYSSAQFSSAMSDAALRDVIHAHHEGYMYECQCGDGCSSGLQAGHRKNVLAPNLTGAGIGEWYCAERHAFYNVQELWRPEADLQRDNPYCDGGFTANPPVPWTTAPAPQ